MKYEGTCPWCSAEIILENVWDDYGEVIDCAKCKNKIRVEEDEVWSEDDY
jgi:hypothetical protein